MAQLVRNPTNIGDIFFSGSQTVKKGQEVTWILDDTWAFKATEDCAVSTNASPFVKLRAGSTFLIYKRTQEDIDAGNQKGIYIFDRDTVVALAYPQEVTQDIIIENDNYNNNYNAITIEASQMPTAKITKSVQAPIVGQAVTLSATSSIAVPPATLVAYEWRIDNIVKSTASSFNFTPTAVTTYGVTLTVTDSDGRKNVVSDNIRANPKPILNDIVKNVTWKYRYDLVTNAWREIKLVNFNNNGTGKVEIRASINIWSLSPGVDKFPDVRVLVNGVQKAYAKVKINKGYNGNTVVTAIGSYYGTLSSSDIIRVQVRDLTGPWTGLDQLAGGGEVQPSDQLQIKITNRTA